jgi:hypothetical protein
MLYVCFLTGDGDRCTLYQIYMNIVEYIIHDTSKTIEKTRLLNKSIL